MGKKKNKIIIWGIQLAANTKLEGRVDKLEGRASIQRDLDRLEKKWTDRNFIKLNNSKCKILLLGRKTLWQWWYKQGTCAWGAAPVGRSSWGTVS